MSDYVSTINTLNHLYQLLLYSALFIFVILLINNLMLYKRKLKDPLTVLLICGIFISIFEILWDYASGKPNLKVLGYISVSGYCCVHHKPERLHSQTVRHRTEEEGDAVACLLRTAHSVPHPVYHHTMDPHADIRG